MDNSVHANGTILNIVGRRSRVPFVPTDWLEAERVVAAVRAQPYRRPMRAVIPGIVLIGLGLALFVAVIAHRGSKHD